MSSADLIDTSTSMFDVFSDHVSGLWFLLRTRSRQEKIIANDLAARGVSHYLPLMTSTRYYGNRKARVELPLFPGYVFLRGAADDAFAADRAGRLAQIIPIRNQSRVNEELKNICFALASKAPLMQFPYLQKGVHVEVRCGPMRGLRGIIEDYAKRNRLILQVEILGRAVSLEVDADVLDVID